MIRFKKNRTDEIPCAGVGILLLEEKVLIHDLVIITCLPHTMLFFILIVSICARRRKLFCKRMPFELHRIVRSERKR